MPDLVEIMARIGMHADIVGIRNNRHGNGLRLVPGRQIAPHLELSQHSIRKRKTYDEYVGEGVMFVTRA